MLSIDIRALNLFTVIALGGALFALGWDYLGRRQERLRRRHT